MLAKRERLTAAGVAATKEYGKTEKSPHFVVRVLQNPTDVGVAVVVSRKIAPRAVDRNRLRRQVFAAVCDIYQNIAQPCAIVIFVRSSADTLSVQLMHNELAETISTALSR